MQLVFLVGGLEHAARPIAVGTRPTTRPYGVGAAGRAAHGPEAECASRAGPVTQIPTPGCTDAIKSRAQRQHQPYINIVGDCTANGGALAARVWQFHPRWHVYRQCNLSRRYAVPSLFAEGNCPPGRNHPMELAVRRGPSWLLQHRGDRRLDEPGRQFLVHHRRHDRYRPGRAAHAPPDPGRPWRAVPPRSTKTPTTAHNTTTPTGNRDSGKPGQAQDSRISRQRNRACAAR